MPENGKSYALPYRDYAERYGASVRTVKRWASHGKTAGDPTPLDDPSAMVAWWERNMTHRVPDEIHAAAGPDSLLKLPAVDPKPAAKPAPAEPPPPAEEPADLDIPTERGLEAELMALETLAARLRRTAHEPGKGKTYLDTVNRMTILSARLREEAERMRQLLPRDTVEAAIHELHGPIEREIRLLYRTMCDLLGLPPSPDREEAWNRELDRLFQRLGTSVLAA